MSRIEEILEEHPQKTQYRDKKKKLKFNLDCNEFKSLHIKLVGGDRRLFIYFINIKVRI